LAAEEPARPAPEDPEALVAREARDRSRAVVAATLAAVLPLLPAIYGLFFLGNTLTDELDQVRFADSHRTELLALAGLTGLGALATGAALLFLYRATKGRRPELLSAARGCAFAGPVLVLAAGVAAQVALGTKAHEFVMSGPQTAAAAKDVLLSGAVQTPQFAGVAGRLAIALAFVLISLNAMRAGLLTRFMGVLGIIAGVLFVLPLGSPLPIVQTFWFGALALLFAGRWPNGMPPAWASGEAVPWPSQLEIREQRERDRAAAEPEPDTDPEPAAVTAGEKAHPASKKRKRKRRR